MAQLVRVKVTFIASFLCKRLQINGLTIYSYVISKHNNFPVIEISCAAIHIYRDGRTLASKRAERIRGWHKYENKTVIKNHDACVGRLHYASIRN